jgi:DeoR family glycerol-3-phosphate regulon repressor
MLSRRHAEILRLLESHAGTLEVGALARRLGVSAETIRRDLRPLAQSGAVVRLHGAVVRAEEFGEAPFQRRMRENAAAKQAVARLVAATIRDGETMMIDTGTTTSYLARELARRRRLTVVTNSTDIARILGSIPGNRVYMAGGELRSDSGAAFGAATRAFVRHFSVQHAIISAGAVDVEGVSDFDLEEAEFARIVLGRGERRVVVTDSTKFGRRGFVAVSPFEGIGELAADRPPPEAIAAAMAAAGCRLLVAPDAG